MRSFLSAILPITTTFLFIASNTFGQGTCATAINIASLPYNQNGLTSCGRGANYSAVPACLTATKFSGEDYVLKYTPAANININVSVAITNSPWNSGLAILDACPGGGVNCLGTNTGANGTTALNLTNISLTAGTTYYILVSGGNKVVPSPPNECVNFNISVTDVLAPCATAPVIASMPYIQAGLTNCGKGATVSGTPACLTNQYFLGEDYILAYTPVANQCINLDAKFNGSPFNSGMAVIEGCPLAAGPVCMGTNTGGVTATALTLHNVSLTAGKTYYLVISGGQSAAPSPPNQCMGFDLKVVDCAASCVNGTVIPSIPYTKTGLTNCGEGASFSGTPACLDPKFFDGEDHVLKYTPTVNQCVNMKATFAAPNASPWSSGMAVLDNCPTAAGVTCLAKQTGDLLSGNLTLSRINMVAGQTYYIVVSGGQITVPAPPNACMSFSFAMSECPVPPPPLPNTPQGIECGNNLGFEDGNLNGWTGYTGTGSATVLPLASATVPGLVPGANSVNGPQGTCVSMPAAGLGARQTLTTGAGTDPNTDGVVPVVAPGARSNSVRIGNSEAGYQAECMEKTFGVNKNNVLFTYLYAVVLQDPGHTDANQPRFEITIKDQGGALVTCGGQYAITSTNAIDDGFINATNPVCGGTNVWYKNWTAVGTDLTPYLGQNVTIRFCSADCAQGGHFGYGYVDTYCKPKEIQGVTLCTLGGTATLTAPAGFSDYVWSPGGQTGQIITVNNPQDGDVYTVTFKSITGSACPTSVKDTIRVITATAGPDTALCAGVTGTKQLTATCNDPNAIYSWTSAPPGFTSTLQNPTVPYPAVNTVYTVVVTSPLGCTLTKTTSITIKTTCGPTVTAAPASVCPGACASVTAVGSAGTPPYTFTWSGGQTGAGPQSLCAAANTIYTVTITDANNQTGTTSVTVTIYPTMTLTPAAINATCNGANNGSASVTVAGGTAAFTYIWAASGGTAATTSNTLAPGTYTVTVTDSKGCTKTATTTITEPPPVTATPSATPATCGSSNGTVSVVAGGGTGSYTYAWLPGGATSQTVSGLAAGTYTVTVKDANGCTTTTSAIVNNTGGVTATIQSSTNATCITPGSAVVTTTGGTGPFVYSWSPSGGTGITANNLTAGTYTVVVTDANNCVSNTTVTITIPPNPTVTTAKVDDNCAQGKGSATASPTGGTGPYNFSWNPGGATASTAGNLLAGTYIVTVTDNNGCTATSSAVVGNIPGPSLTTAFANSTCFGANNGSASVTATGGTPAFTYIWAATGGTSATTTNTLSAGTYTVTVTDAAGCTISSSVTITEPPQINVSVATTSAACGATDGTASVTASGGTGALTYTWTPGGITSATITGLSAGAYTVLVTDATNCTASSTALVNSTGGVSATIQTSTNATCVTPGSAVVTTAGGAAPFTYSWSPSGGTAATATGLAAGTYTVVVTDANNCISNTTVTITIPTGPTLTTTHVDDNCGKGVGSATVTPAGGLTPYTYLWNPGGITFANANSLFANTYTVTVTDANGCTATSTVVVANLNGPTATATSTNINCFGANNGTAQVSTTGGATPYTYRWMPGASTATSLTALSAGTYTITVSDQAGCTSTSTTTITEPPQINISAVTTDANCNASNGSAVITVGGGTGAFTQAWLPVGGTGLTATNLAAGSYTVTVTDASACTATSAVLIANVGAPVITLGPVTNVLCAGGNNGSASITIAGGTPAYVISWSPAGGTGATAGSLTAGSYTIVVTDAVSCVQNTVVVITEPLPLTATATGVSPNCPGNGTVSVIPGGGTTGYTYNWMPGGALTQTASVTTAGIYTVTVTDANNCTTTSTASITTPSPLVLTSTPVDGSCGLSNGSASVAGSGGTPGYTYAWVPAGAGQTSTGLAAATYTITITDSNGCTETTTAIVGNTPPVTVTSTSTDVSCAGGNDGTVTATPGGGTGTMTYVWSPTTAGTSATASTLIAGTYTVSITDSKGCTATSSTTITEPTPLTLSAPPVGKICIGQNATLTATGGGGTPAYTYGWMPGAQPGPSISVSPAITTTYTVIITDSKGCTTSSTVVVNVGPPLQVTTVNGKVVCLGSSTSISASATGGDGNYTYLWQPGNLTGTPLTVTPTGTQIYTVTVSDGCGTPVATSVATAEGVSPMITPMFSPDSSYGCVPLCIKFSNISTGGISKTCSWDFGDGGTSQSCNPNYCYRKTGMFSVKLFLTDSNGCSSSITKTNSIQVFPMPVAGFAADPKSTSILSPTISFTDKSSPNVVKWDWSFGDVPNSSSSKKNPTYTYKDTGKYEVQLIVTTLYGCKDTVTDIVVIHGDYTFFVPNAFSPNNDGKNETFFPKGIMIDAACFRMLIFDRWGNLIFATTDLKMGWDGRANGGEEIAQQDVYVWKIETCDYSGKKYKYLGHVTLVK